MMQHGICQWLANCETVLNPMPRTVVLGSTEPFQAFDEGHVKYVTHFTFCYVEIVQPSSSRVLLSVMLSINPFKSRVRHFSCRALQSYNLPGDWARELFKPSTDLASLVVEIEKKTIFWFRWGFFWRWRQKEGMFWKSWPPLAGPGLQPIDPFFWCKVLLKTRWKSASIEPLIDLLAYLWPKLWAKNPKTQFLA